MPHHLSLIIILSILGYFLIGTILYVLEAFLPDEDRFKKPQMIVAMWLPFILLVVIAIPFALIGDLLKYLRNKISDRQEHLRFQKEQKKREEENKKREEARKRHDHAMRYL